MASHASAKKSIRKTARQTVVNRNRISRVRTYIKKMAKDVESGVNVDLTKSLTTMQREVMRGTAKGVLHKNTAARIISKWNLRVKRLIES